MTREDSFGAGILSSSKFFNQTANFFFLSRTLHFLVIHAITLHLFLVLLAKLVALPFSILSSFLQFLFWGILLLFPAYVMPLVMIRDLFNEEWNPPHNVDFCNPFCNYCALELQFVVDLCCQSLTQFIILSLILVENCQVDCYKIVIMHAWHYNRCHGMLRRMNFLILWRNKSVFGFLN